MEDFKITLAAARINRGMRQEDVAKRLGVSKQSIVNWERGRRKPNAATIMALSQIYEIDVDHIFLPKEFTLS